MLVLAHAGHWIESILILVPTLGFIGWLAVVTLRERRRERRGEREERGANQSPAEARHARGSAAKYETTERPSSSVYASA